MYGLDHDLPRFQAEAAMELRPDIGISGLYLSGQVKQLWLLADT